MRLKLFTFRSLRECESPPSCWHVAPAKCKADSAHILNLRNEKSKLVHDGVLRQDRCAHLRYVAHNDEYLQGKGCVRLSHDYCITSDTTVVFTMTIFWPCSAVHVFSGDEPEHLDDDHPKKQRLSEIARLARCLGKRAQSGS
ncbi:hypothetical protein CA13_69790 [Planctomycetes bacterium CA13]|uniref:Uncharacterized protein n=1 Tax=Novipirellula herctigrandis TaxID=2527986 RepID=A0A5C5YNN7_9BACT|nr:hypothetical protein CA13_69790 [Planctomycetes bacterium CA13]